MWAILVPEALAYATIAGVSPVVGLYAAPGALILYAAFGSSRRLVVGPAAAAAALSAATVGDLVARTGDDFTQMTAALAISVGLAAIIAGVLRLGFLANFISEPVLKGFIVGLSLTILVGQVPKLFGVDGGDGDFFQKLWAFLSHLGGTSGLTLAVGAASLAVVMVLKRSAPGAPGSLIVVFAGIALVKGFNLDQHGVATVGHIKSGLPSLGVPSFGIRDFGSLAAGAIGVMLIGFAEGLGAAKTYAAPDHDEIDANRELIGLGTANLAAGLSSGMVVNGSLSKTALNVSSGARTQLSGLVVAVMTVVTILFLTGLFEDLPETTLAAVVVAALIELIDIPALRGFYRVYTRRLGRVYGLAARADFIAAIAAMLGVMVFDTLPGLFIGIGVSLVLLIYRTSIPNIARLGRVDGVADHWEDLDRHAQAVEEPGVVVLRPEAGLFFANADEVRRAVLAAAGEGIVAIVIDAETVPFIDITAAEMLVALRADLEPRGVRLMMARDVGQVRDLLESSERGAFDRTTFSTVEAAVVAARPGGESGGPAA